MLKVSRENAVVAEALVQAELQKEKFARVNKVGPRNTKISTHFEYLETSQKKTKGFDKIFLDGKDVSDDKETSHISDFDANNAGQEHMITETKISRVENWGKGEVSRWLTTLNLENYCDTFMQHQINGEVLLELSLEDLDYMSIKALGHRKTILKEIENLRHNNCSKSIVFPPISEMIPCNSPSPAVSEVTLESMKPVMKHWSHIKPLSSSTVNPCVLDSNFVNLADNVVPSEILDEDAEHAAFQRAVMAWRNADESYSSPSSGRFQTGMTRLKSAENGVSASLESMGGSSVWQNPFSIKKEVGSADRGITTSAVEMKFTATSESSSLEEEKLNEEEEHEKFKKAVAVWRGGNDNNKLQNVVEHVSVKLEEEFSQYALTLEKQKEEAMEKLNQARLKLPHTPIKNEDHGQLLCAHTRNIPKNTKLNSEESKDEHNTTVCDEEEENMGSVCRGNRIVNYNHREIMDMQMVESVIDYDNNLLSSFVDCMNYYVIEYDSESEASEVLHEGNI